MLARLRKMQEENEEGFTLIELLVVIIIIGILAAIAIPVFLSQRQKGYDAGVKSDLRNMATAEESYLTDFPASYADGSVPAGLTADGFKSSSAGDYDSTDGPGVYIAIDTNKGYCLVGVSSSGNAFLYQSEAGGLSASNPFNSGTGATKAATDFAAAKAGCTTITTPVWNGPVS